MLFKEGNYATSQTSVHQIGQLVEGDVTIKVIDIIGLGDTSLSMKQVLRSLAKASLELMDGITIVLFTFNGRIPKTKLDHFKVIYDYLFKKDILAYTTIVRTGFDGFQDATERASDINAIKSLDQDGWTQYCSILHVDNSSTRIDPQQLGRNASRLTVMTHIRSKQLAAGYKPYIPNELNGIMIKVENYMTPEELEKQRLDRIREEKRIAYQLWAQQQERNRVEAARLEAARWEKIRLDNQI
eukprot:gene5742-6644_t